jgi:hypothetical protein
MKSTKKLIYLFIIFICTLSLSGCTNLSDLNINDAGLDLKSLNPWIGSWSRQATFVDGVNQNSDPANLDFYQGNAYYSTTAKCFTSGSYSVVENTMTMVMEVTDCPGGVQPPFTLTYDFTISDDGEEMIFVVNYMGTEIKEIYNSQGDGRMLIEESEDIQER